MRRTSRSSCCVHAASAREPRAAAGAGSRAQPAPAAQAQAGQPPPTAAAGAAGLPHRHQLRSRRRHRHRQAGQCRSPISSSNDFEVLEDGKPQTVETFRLIKVDARGARVTPQRAIRTRDDEETAAADEDSRIFVFFLDDYHVRLGNSMAARKPLVRLRPQPARRRTTSSR